ncbi:MAG: hypothetical protein QOI78_6603 [Actinomycetota bacterium]|jgi:hypothetical protein|nr:hypothetical protein [Actinomycetota bacterium]
MTALRPPRQRTAPAVPIGALPAESAIVATAATALRRAVR